MGSLETNKIFAAILVAGLIAMVTGIVSRIVVHPTHPEESAYKIDISALGSAEAAPAPEGPYEVASIAPLLASADPAAGQAAAAKCGACHNFDKGGANKVGPNLFGVVNRPHAAHEGYSYSKSMAALSDEVWDYDHLNTFLSNPKKAVPGTKMNFAGIKAEEERANLIAWLRTLADSPAPLP
jgi:cytochrome c